ncbi:hypothetical protein MUK42_18091 [Musa troglodytarum]|uniref:Uncharacterized protein n=1 Tax=Musa troglodytarum TaxID=320322 RepID=A0A9E7HZM7_9LILI|nr:hypothetical protein MUK42_18091 [Musa troglodytarum]
MQGDEQMPNFLARHPAVSEGAAFCSATTRAWIEAIGEEGTFWAIKHSLKFGYTRSILLYSDFD